MDEGAGGHGAGRDGSHCKGARSSGLLEGRKRREACGRRIGRRRLQAGVVDAEPRRRWQCVWGKALWGLVRDEAASYVPGKALWGLKACGGDEALC